MAYLRKRSADPYSNKHGIPIETFEDVALTVNLARINFVEQCHQNERVEYDGEMLRRRRVDSGVFIATAVNVKRHVTYIPHTDSNVNLRCTAMLFAPGFSIYLCRQVAQWRNG